MGNAKAPSVRDTATDSELSRGATVGRAVKTASGYGSAAAVTIAAGAGSHSCTARTIGY